MTIGGDNTVRVLANNGSGVFSPLGSPIALATRPTAIAAADFDGSTLALGASIITGRDDLAITLNGASRSAPGSGKVLINDGFGGFALATFGTVGSNPVSVDPADVDNDRDTDIIIGDGEGQFLMVFMNNGFGNLVGPAPSVYPTTGTVAQVRAADLNGDGDIDLASVNDSTGSVSIFLNQGSGTGEFGPEGNFIAGSNARSIQPVDLDGDNDVDLAVLQDGSTTPEVLILRNDTNGPNSSVIFSQDQSLPVGPGALKLAAGAFDDDGGADLVTVDTGISLFSDAVGPPTTGTASLLFNQSKPVTPCPADIAPIGGNLVVNVQDLLAVISAWGACANPNNCPADIAPLGPPMGDDVVNVADLLTVISAWGPCS